MNVHSLSPMPPTQTLAEPSVDRRAQILDAAVVCFAKRGFHQASMHDISAEAGISVGLIYRYFENKEEVISAMAARHKNEIQEVMERARQAPTLLESLEILFTAHCCENSPQIQSAFVVDLYAEASRNAQIADLVRDVLQTAMNGVTDLIARSPEAKERRAWFDANRNVGTYLCCRAWNVDARCIAATKAAGSRQTRPPTRSDSQIVARVVQK